MEIEGKVISVCEAKTGEGKNGQWKSQDFIIETGGQYPKKVCLNVFGEKLTIPTVGQTVVASFDPESREYNGNWFTTLRVWKLEGGQAASGVASPTPVTTEPEKDDSLPF